MSWSAYLENYLTNFKYTGKNISGTNKYAAIIGNKNGCVWAQSSPVCSKISFQEVSNFFENPNATEIVLMGEKVLHLHFTIHLIIDADIIALVFQCQEGNKRHCRVR